MQTLDSLLGLKVSTHLSLTCIHYIMHIMSMLLPCHAFPARTYPLGQQSRVLLTPFLRAKPM